MSSSERRALLHGQCASCATPSVRWITAPASAVATAGCSRNAVRGVDEEAVTGRLVTAVIPGCGERGLGQRRLLGSA